MSPDPEDVVESEQQDEVDDIDQENEKSQEAAAKRRTKTGCLTCRKRRIKCGEERPTCKNCIKSKRECAGYNPPLVYKRGHEGPLSIPTYDTGSLNGYTRYPTNYHGYDPRQHVSLQYGQHISQTRLSSGNPIHTLNQGYTHHPTQHGTQVGHTSAHTQWPMFASRPSITSDPAFATAESIMLEPRRQSTTFSEQSVAMMPNIPYAASLTSGAYSEVASSITSIPPSALHYPETQISTYSEREFNGRRPSARTEPTNGSHVLTVDTDNDIPDDPYDVMDNSQIVLPENRAYDYVQSAPGDQLISYTQMDFQKSPLVNSQSQRIFQHFIIVTGPNMSIFDHLEDAGPYDPPRMVWTHGLPAMAFNYPALAHTILSISAMQLAKLGQGSQDTALKHFTLALRRAGKLLASDESRHHVSTLATVLLLAYYEVVVGDHSRWSLHLSGAARLVMEYNYAAIFRTIRRMRKRAKANLLQSWAHIYSLSDHDYVHVAAIPEGLLDDGDWEVDHRLISRLMGIDVDYDSQTQSSQLKEPEIPDFSKAQVDDLKILMEMYWWYIKQDIFQSMLSGDVPMLPYSKMKYCPPRGPIGRAERPHATMDHLWLVMARLVTFGAIDKSRKLRVVASQGGEWIPPPGFLMMPQMPPHMPNFGAGAQASGPPNPSLHNLQNSNHAAAPIANEGRTRKVKNPAFVVPGAAQAPMYGMIPPPKGPIHMSTSFNAMNAELQKDTDVTPETAHSSDTPNSELDLTKALAEHASITAALDLFERSLGSDFDPLSGGDHLATPFGTPLRYKSPTIAAIWTFYHVCRILLRRLHPHSPPAAMISAGVNAFATREHAQTIGKIIGGLYAQHNILVDAGHVDHMFTAALMETTFPLLFAAVQYQDPTQRGWTIAKLGDIAQSTGWSSSSAVAAACETSWERMGMAGKGPPYTRTLDRRNSDARVSGRNRDAQMNSRAPSQMDAVAEHVSRFVSHDRELIAHHGSTRAYWAVGLLSVEEDLQKMELAKKDDDDGEN